jgi:hypothetical protein
MGLSVTSRPVSVRYYYPEGKAVYICTICSIYNIYYVYKIPRSLQALQSRLCHMSHSVLRYPTHLNGSVVSVTATQFGPLRPVLCCEQFHLREFGRLLKSRDSSVGIALGYGLDDQGSRVRFPAWAGNFSLHHRIQKGSEAHSASYPMGTRGSFPGGKAAGT